MLRFALIGAGRIGRMHADHIAACPGATLEYMYDVSEKTAHETACKHDVRIAPDVNTAITSCDVDAVLIASPTETHVDLIIKAIRADKPVLCEKPISLDIHCVNRCRTEVKNCGVPVQIGFNRRFDPTHSALHNAVDDGAVGHIEQIVITSRDPSPPPLEYLKQSGGLFRDMMIHDFDLARFLMGEEFTVVSAVGSTLIDPAIAEIGDVDTAMVVMVTTSGAQCQISCSRRAVFGYDQRVEVFGSRGMVQSDNRRATGLIRNTAESTNVRDPLQYFFVERYAEAYMHELDDFITTVETRRSPSVTFEDGRRALILADAAGESLRNGASVHLTWPDDD